MVGAPLPRRTVAQQRRLTQFKTLPERFGMGAHRGNSPKVLEASTLQGDNKLWLRT